MKRDGLRYRVVGQTGRLVLNGLFATARFDFTGREHFRWFRDRGEPCILVLWHGRLLPLTYVHRGQDIVALVSRSEDGEFITRVLDGWGYRTVRGSSSRGGVPAFRELVRHARAGRTISFTPDGPRGPRQKLKPGALAAAQVTGLPLVPLAAGTDRAWWIEGWDRFLVPKPFARIRVAYGPPRKVPRDAGHEELDRIARELEVELDRLLEVVDAADRS